MTPTTEEFRLIVGALVDEAARRFASANLMDLDVGAEELELVFESLLSRRGIGSPEDRKRLIEAATNEVLGFGPIHGLMTTPGVTDILINGWDRIVFEKGGRLHPYEGSFHGPEHLRAFVHRHVARAERSVNRASPWVDVELKDGSRMHVVSDPIAQSGPFVSIRRFPEKSYTLEDLAAFGAISDTQMDWLRGAVERRLNLIIAGAPGVGKTTLLVALLGLVPQDQRIILVEDVSEMHVDHPHCIKLQTRRLTYGEGEQANIRKLVRETLRMRPDRLVVGEVRGEEVFDMISAMSIGLSGSMSTLHAGSVSGALLRLETLYAAATAGQIGVNPGQALRSAIGAIIFMRRDEDGRRMVSEIRELGDGL